MSQRVFGPVQGAGVQVTEKDGEKPIEPGALGLVGYAGILERGETNKLLGPFTSKKAFNRQCGSIISDSTLPDNVEQYLEVANGAGGVLLVRVTDGNEVAAGPYPLFDNITRTYNLFSRRTTLTPFGQVTAKSGGRHGGKAKVYTDLFTLTGDLTATTLTSGLTKFKHDEWKGGYIELGGVPNKRYPILGNTALGVFTVQSDQTMAADLAAGADPTLKRYYLVLDEDATKRLTIEIRDGQELPDAEFGMFVYVDGALVYQQPNLSIDPTNKRYWVNLINNDPGNLEITVTDSFVGARTADVRPANGYGVIATVTATVLTATIHEFAVTNSPTGGNPTLALGTTTDAYKKQTITITMTAPTSGTAVSDRFGALGTVTLGTLFSPPTGAGGALKNKWVPPFTVTAGATPLVAADTLSLKYKPLPPNELAGGFVYPDKVNGKRIRFRIASNDHKTITAVDGSDMTTIGATSDEFLFEAPLSLVAGRDGVADLADANYTLQGWSTDTSPFNRVVGKNFGLIKFATPGNTSSVVQKAGVAYATAKNHQYRYEIPDNILTEADADTYVNDTLGRSDYAVVIFPSFVDVADPLGGGEGKIKRISATGMVHGREAAIVRDFKGYHKAGAGEEATLPAVVSLPTGETVLNEELLNPRGINVLKKIKGNFVIWGDRTLWTDPQWKFKHQREQMSYYEHVLQESFGFIVFAINNAVGRSIVHSSMISFFLPEYAKGALDTDFPFKEACAIKIDKENNTPAVKAAGDMVCEILLRQVDTVERLRILIGKAGIFESTVR